MSGCSLVPTRTKEQPTQQGLRQGFLLFLSCPGVSPVCRNTSHSRPTRGQVTTWAWPQKNDSVFSRRSCEHTCGARLHVSSTSVRRGAAGQGFSCSWSSSRSFVCLQAARAKIGKRLEAGGLGYVPWGDRDAAAPRRPPGPPPAPPGFCAVGCCSEPLGLQFPVVNQFAALETC